MRWTLALTLALLPLPALAAKKPPLVRAALIHFPGPAGAELHGRIALPAKARGRQPAILVLGDGDRPEIGQLVETLAREGYVACAIRGQATPDTARATIAWLGGNPYATGRVALAATDAADPIAAALLADPPAFLAAAILPGGAPAPEAPTPLRRLPDRATLAPEDVPGLSAFLKEHLR